MIYMQTTWNIGIWCSGVTSVGHKSIFLALFIEGERKLAKGLNTDRNSKNVLLMIWTIPIFNKQFISVFNIFWYALKYPILKKIAF